MFDANDCHASAKWTRCKTTTPQCPWSAGSPTRYLLDCYEILLKRQTSRVGMRNGLSWRTNFTDLSSWESSFYAWFSSKRVNEQNHSRNIEGTIKDAPSPFRLDHLRHHLSSSNRDSKYFAQHNAERNSQKVHRRWLKFNYGPSPACVLRPWGDSA